MTDTQRSATHDMDEQQSAVPGDESRRAICSCGWNGRWRSMRDDGEGWYGQVALDVIDHLRFADA